MIIRLAAYLVVIASLSAQSQQAPPPVPPNRIFDAASNKTPEKIAPYEARFGRNRPVIAVVGENSGAELTDFVIPYGVLSQSGVAEVTSVSTQPGVLKLGKAVTIQPQETIEQFDRRFPQGADYVIVPYIPKSDDPALLRMGCRSEPQGKYHRQHLSRCDRSRQYWTA